ncbi:MAG TPA: hypothetical protein VFW23_10830 [Tepidisphaeraceae bacterium]|nr:hypothetical protein [Tepidisphaeraceae bacterium]
MATSICLFFFLISPLILSFPEDLVPLFIGCAFIGTVGLAFARTSGERAMTFLTTAASLVIASCLWHAGVDHLQSRVEAWKNTALINSLATSRPSTSRPTTQP